MSTQAKTLPARYYTDPENFRREMETFFCEKWVCVGRSERIPTPGDFFLREVAGESVIVTRDEHAIVRAFYNVCRHRGCPLGNAGLAYAQATECPPARTRLALRSVKTYHSAFLH